MVERLVVWKSGSKLPALPLQIGLLLFRDLDFSEGDGHVFSAVKLEAEGAFFDGCLGFVGDACDSVEPGFIGVSCDFDFENVPVLGFHGGDRFLAFDGVAFAGDVGRGGEIAFEGTGDANLDLIVGLLEHDAGVDGAFTEFVFEGESEIGEFFFGPEKGAGFFGSGLAVDQAVFDGPMGDLAFGVNAPVFEVFSVKKRLGLEKGEGEEENDEEFHDLTIRGLGSGLSFADHSGDEAGSEEGDHESGDHLAGDDFIENEPSPEDTEKGDEKGDGGRDGGTGALDELKEKDEGEGGADEGKGEGTHPAMGGGIFFRELGEGERNENESGSEEAAGGGDERADTLEFALHPAGSEAVTKAGNDAGDDGPTVTVFMKLELAPNEDEDSEDAEAKADELGGAESFV
ncbi:MAG: hypothetical protein ACI8UZ_000903 [Akkermansiaceae bacterium]